jgi:hypothetical protein
MGASSALAAGAIWPHRIPAMVRTKSLVFAGINAMILAVKNTARRSTRYPAAKRVLKSGQELEITRRAASSRSFPSVLTAGPFNTDSEMISCLQRPAVFFSDAPEVVLPS